MSLEINLLNFIKTFPSNEKYLYTFIYFLSDQTTNTTQP